MRQDGIDNDCDGIIDPCGFNGNLESNSYIGFNPTFTNDPAARESALLGNSCNYEHF